MAILRTLHDTETLQRPASKGTTAELQRFARMTPFIACDTVRFMAYTSAFARYCSAVSYASRHPSIAAIHVCE